MTLEVGTQLGSFEITGLLGKGGMGEVYRATDRKLGRDVAIKTLPATLADDADRLARFEREAKLLATLNHAHIAAVHSLDETDGTLYIAMELVEGESLEAKLKSGPLPLDDALQFGLQIASALEAAHEKGVVHRDLKPANIMITPDGMIKVLDFGLAKAFSGNPSEASPAHSPALSVAMTQQGLVLGTAGYMSPEQASGQATDQRADVWAFGVVMYEMLTGQPVFSGESVPHILADVLKSTPDWGRLPEPLHPRLKLMLERCLTKRPRDRYTGIADARVDIEAALRDPEGATKSDGAAGLQPSKQRALPIAAAAFAVGLAVAGFAVWFLLRAEPLPLSRFDVTPPDEFAIASNSGSLAISPDGRSIAYLSMPVGGGPGGRQLRVRRLDQLESTALVDLTNAPQGTPDQAYNPFFSPDGTQIGYYDAAAGGASTLRRVSIQGGAPSMITVLPGNLRGASWGDDDTIVFATTAGDSGLWRVRATGGELEQLTTPDTSTGAVNHFWPEMLPGAEAVLFTIAKGTEDTSEIAVLSLVTGEQRVLLNGGSSPRYSASGHVLYGRAGTLFALPFDPRSLETRGPAVPVLERVATKGEAGATEAALSADGTLLYLSRSADAMLARRLLWVDSAGQETAVPTPPRLYDQVVLSPDETRAAVRLENDTSVWIADLERGTLQRLVDSASSLETVVLVFSDDGRQIVYSVRRSDGSVDVVRQAIDGSGEPEVLAALGMSSVPASAGFVPGGEQMLLSLEGASAIYKVGIVDIGDPDSYRDFIVSPSHVYGAQVRADGEWMTFGSQESGALEVYVQRFPDGGGRRPATIGGAVLPTWTGDGRSLVYLGIAGGATRDAIKLPVSGLDGSAESLQFGSAEVLLPWPYYAQLNPRSQYGMTADGERFLVISGTPSGAGTDRMILVQNWFDELERLAPAD